MKTTWLDLVDFSCTQLYLYAMKHPDAFQLEEVHRAINAMRRGCRYRPVDQWLVLLAVFVLGVLSGQALQ